jgi:hypothetical protein
MITMPELLKKLGYCMVSQGSVSGRLRRKPYVDWHTPVVPRSCGRFWKITAELEKPSKEEHQQNLTACPTQGGGND